MKLTIQPTSVEAERAFSACGLFATDFYHYNFMPPKMFFTHNSVRPSKRTSNLVLHLLKLALSTFTYLQ